MQHCFLYCLSTRLHLTSFVVRHRMSWPPFSGQLNIQVQLQLRNGCFHQPDLFPSPTFNIPMPFSYWGRRRPINCAARRTQPTALSGSKLTVTKPTVTSTSLPLRSRHSFASVARDTHSVLGFLTRSLPMGLMLSFLTCGVNAVLLARDSVTAPVRTSYPWGRCPLFLRARYPWGQCRHPRPRHAQCSRLSYALATHGVNAVLLASDSVTAHLPACYPWGQCPITESPLTPLARSATHRLSGGTPCY